MLLCEGEDTPDLRGELTVRPFPGAQLCGSLVDREGSLCPSPPADEDGGVVTVGGFCAGKRQGKWAQLLSDSVPTGFSVPLFHAGQSASGHSIVF